MYMHVYACIYIYMYIYVFAYTDACSIFQWVGGNKNICYKKDRRLSSLEPHHFVDGGESRPQAFGRVASCPNHICQKHASDKCDDARAWKHSQRLDIIKQCQADRPLAPSKLWCAPDAFSILQHFVLYLMPANKDGGLRARLFSANIPQESGHGLLDPSDSSAADPQLAIRLQSDILSLNLSVQPRLALKTAMLWILNQEATKCVAPARSTTTW